MAAGENVAGGRTFEQSENALRSLGVAQDVEEFGSEDVEPALSRLDPPKRRIYVYPANDRNRPPSRLNRIHYHLRPLENDLRAVLPYRLSNALEPRVNCA